MVYTPNNGMTTIYPQELRVAEVRDPTLSNPMYFERTSTINQSLQPLPMNPVHTLCQQELMDMLNQQNN